MWGKNPSVLGLRATSLRTIQILTLHIKYVDLQLSLAFPSHVGLGESIMAYE
jgi:hypothetical protein